MFIFREPPLSYVSNLFTLPFNRSVWIALGALLIIIFIVLYVISQWEWKKGSEDFTKPSPTIIDNILLIFSAIGQQGSLMTL